MATLVAVITSLIAGFLNAVSGVLQRKGIGTPDSEKLYTKEQLIETSKSSLWRLGVAAEAIAAALELIALYFGSLLLVEPLLVTDLIFLLAIVHFKFKSRVTTKEWSGILAVCAGLSVLLIAANPHGGKPKNSLSWLLPTIIIVLLMLISASATKRIKNDKKRGAFGAFTGGLSLGLTAALTRLTMLQLHDGIIHTLSNWPVYGLIISAIISIFAIQVAYGSGPLIITQPVLEITSPIISILLGLILFGDAINKSSIAITGELIGLIATIIGVIMLSTSKRVLKLESRHSL